MQELWNVLDFFVRQFITIVMLPCGARLGKYTGSRGVERILKEGPSECLAVVL